MNKLGACLPQAAETAESAMNAKLSMKYYELAAECEGMME